ncbi:MAG TPA: hypothetical protein VF720_05550, partial [Candidatus Eisenbacteria bacterium]
RIRAPIVFLAAWTAIIITGPARIADSTPLYAAREGRTCDNCHLTPNSWVNPPLAERKCTMSCQACHVDPAGGGVRNASGRFFGRATLPMIATSPRPTQDWDRGAFGMGRHDRATTYSDSLPQGPVDHAAVGAPGPYREPDDLWAHGRPAGSPSRYSLFQGRYGVVAADPIFRLGWDMRLATLISGSALVFPMQADLQGVLHPVEHVTGVAAVGARGRSRGFSTTLDEPESPYLRTAYVLLAEAPYQSYVKAGRFVPAYGLRLDNHTAFIRRGLHLDDAIPESRVTGVEVGASPNYPYINASWFRSKAEGVAPDAFDVFDVDDSYGYAASGGWRGESIAWGASWLARRRPADEGGNETATGGWVMVNPFRGHPSFPLTWQAELDRLAFHRAGGTDASGLFFYQEFDWLLGNGVNLLATQEWEDPDRAIKDDDSIRAGIGAQVTPIPGITLDGRMRGLVPAGGSAGVDFILQAHFWN